MNSFACRDACGATAEGEVSPPGWYYLEIVRGWRCPACCAALEKARIEPGTMLSHEEVRSIFMAHGFTIKEGQTDLKPYVYDAAWALMREVLSRL